MEQHSVSLHLKRFLVLMICTLYPVSLAHGATGVITIPQPPPLVITTGFIPVSVTVQLTEDSTPFKPTRATCNEPVFLPFGPFLSGITKERAVLYYTVNGSPTATSGFLVMAIRVDDFHDDLGRVFSFNIFARLQAINLNGQNTFRIWFQDIYGVQPNCNVTLGAAVGDLITEKRIAFYVTPPTLTLQRVSPQNQEGEAGKPLLLPLEVKVADQNKASVPGIGISWVLTSWPGKAQGQANPGAGVSPTSGTTGANGQAQASLTLGTLPGTYTVEARCPQCINGSPVVFTAEAKRKCTLSLEASLFTVRPGIPQASVYDAIRKKRIIFAEQPPGEVLLTLTATDQTLDSPPTFKVDFEPEGHGHPFPENPGENLQGAVVDQAGQILYRAGTVGGKAHITASGTCGGAKVDSNKVTVTVSVGEEAFPALGLGKVSVITPLTTGHTDNMHGQPATLALLQVLAAAYYGTFSETLVVTSIGLPNGGMFDLCEDWNPTRECGYITHNMGTDVDIDDMTHEGHAVDQKFIKRILKTFKGIFHPEGDHLHLRFPPLPPIEGDP